MIFEGLLKQGEYEYLGSIESIKVIILLWSPTKRSRLFFMAIATSCGLNPVLVTCTAL